MTSQLKTDTRTERELLLERHANRIYEAMVAAQADGYQVVIRGFFLDLYDPRIEKRTPLPGVVSLED